VRSITSIGQNDSVVTPSHKQSGQAMGASSSASCQHGQDFTAMAWGLSNCYEKRIEIDRCAQPISQRQAIWTTVPACSLPLFLESDAVQAT